MKMKKASEPNAILMAKQLKEKRKKEEEKKQNKDKIDKGKIVIEELERQGELKEDVPIGGEAFEDEQPRQG
jgi:hypothetical protein